ncbi:MAG: hypothetical protein AAFV72_00345 [Cyanobacteria bacterium J06635_1]
MDYKAALAAVKGLENGAELASAIEGKVSDLESKNFTVIGEKRAETQKRQAMQTALEGIGKSLGIEGDVEAILGSAQGKVQTLTSERDAAVNEKTALETRATEAEGKITGFERKQKFTDAAAKAKANAAVLERLLGDKADELKVDGDKVLVGDKPLREYVEGDEALKPFLPALFAEQTVPDPKGKKTELPGGNPNANNGNDQADPLKRHVARHRISAESLTKKTA